MSRFAGLPRRTSSEQDRSSATRPSPLLRPTIRRAARAATGGALSLAIPLILGASALPAAQADAAAAPAAAFAVAGLIGTTGDAAVGMGTAADTMLQGGTLAFGNPNDPPPDAPAFGGSTDKNDPSADPRNEPAAPTTTAEPAAPVATPEPVPSPAPSVAPSDDPDARIAARGLKVSEFARRYVGYPYRYGAAGPRAFDCSGLTLYIYRQVGVSLPHKASLQFSARYGRRVASSDALIPGDLVYFRNTAGPGITHTAVYIGNGMMVSASTPRYGVQLVSLSNAYWRRHYAGAIRPGL